MFLESLKTELRLYGGSGEWMQRDCSVSCAYQEKGRPEGRPNRSHELINYIAMALSMTTCVQPPTGSLEITGSEPPARSVSIVRW